MTKRKPSRGAERAFRGSPREGSGRGQWIYGTHPVLAALANPRRRCHRIVLTAEAERALGQRLAGLLRERPTLQLETMARSDIDHVLPGAVHQGVVLLADPLDEPDLDDVLREVGGLANAILLVLDQVTDPHNVGAILRSASAFGALAVIITERHAPDVGATLAKSASGALECTPLVRVTNLARALKDIKNAGFWCAGLDADAPASITEARLEGRVALVLGAEGQGMRRLTREHCDLIVRIPIAQGSVASLNVSNAAAVALYELSRTARQQLE